MTYEEYVEIRNSLKMKDSDVAKAAQVPPSTFTDWKKGKSKPKEEKMCKIKKALGINDESQRPEEISEEQFKNSALVISHLMKLNGEGFAEALKRLEELTHLPQYQKDEKDEKKK